MTGDIKLITVLKFSFNIGFLRSKESNLTQNFAISKNKF